jgi:2-amino-4-hydroxy-6-hydroxymethyldihydropteridine diphosphokinase
MSGKSSDPQYGDPASGGVSVLLGLGSNLGDRRRNIETALQLLAQAGTLEVVAVSRLIETDPVGGPPQGVYLNGAAEIRTGLPPQDLLEGLHSVEAQLGRVRSALNGPREIDLDILLYGGEVVRQSSLEIPHPRMLERGFVLEPLAEIAPERLHPLSKKTISEHWRALGAAGETGTRRSSAS